MKNGQEQLENSFVVGAGVLLSTSLVSDREFETFHA